MSNLTLFFDNELTGHHSEYINHLVDYIVLTQIEDKFIFLVHPHFPTLFPGIVSKSNASANILFLTISEKELKSVSECNFIIKSINTIKLINIYALKYSVNKVFMLYFNTFQLALCVFRPKFKIDGILFLPFFRMEKKTPLSILKYYRKYIQTWLLVKNKQIRRLFVLNDLKTTLYLNKEFKTDIFQMLPDPIPVLNQLPGFSLRDNFEIPNNRKILLHFGAFSKRKGSLTILEAFSMMEVEVMDKIALIYVGHADFNMHKLILKRIQNLEKKYPNSLIIYKNEFVSNEMMKCLFDQCDVVLVPYTNVEASSGIVGHAISSKKPLIGTKSGLLGEMIVKNDAGICIDNSSPESILKGINLFLSNALRFTINDLYVIEHSTQNFASSILNK